MLKIARIAAAAFASTAVLVAVASIAQSSAGESAVRMSTSSQFSSASNFTYGQAQSFTGWSLYDTGPSYTGIPLTDVLRRNDPATYDAESLLDSAGANYVAFLYGTCSPQGEAGCPAPLEIQSWPACSRELDVQTVAGVPTIEPDETVLIRGVYATFYDDWSQLEIHIGNANVVLFGDNRAQLLSAANALRGVNNSLRPAPARFPIPLECR